MTETFNIDCMEYMKTLEDNAFDLAIVDPPYGDALGENTRFNDRHGSGLFDRYGIEHFHKGLGREKRSDRYVEAYVGEPVSRTDGGYAEKYGNKILTWDIAPKQEYFEELFRVSKNQIIWGGNYFELPPTRCFVVWRKLTISEKFTMAMCEYAWTSFNANAKVCEFAPQGKKSDPRFHPTQKPIELYEWLLDHYAKPGDRILDTHMGSGSSRIACHRKGFDYVGCEIDQGYFELEEERFARMTAQRNIFEMEAEDDNNRMGKET